MGAFRWTIHDDVCEQGHNFAWVAQDKLACPVCVTAELEEARKSSGERFAELSAYKHLAADLEDQCASLRSQLESTEAERAEFEGYLDELALIFGPGGTVRINYSQIPERVRALCSRLEEVERERDAAKTQLETHLNWHAKVCPVTIERAEANDRLTREMLRAAQAEALKRIHDDVPDYACEEDCECAYSIARRALSEGESK